MPLLKKPKLLGWERDSAAPTLTTVTFVSNNADTTKAKVGNVVTLTWVGSEALKDVVATIVGNNVTIVKASDTNYSATYTLVSGDANGSIPITIDFKDLNGVSGTKVVATTGGEIVTFDKTAPTLSSAIRDTNTQITVTLSEVAKAASITKANAGGFTVFMTGTPGTTYAVSAIAPGDTDAKVVLTVADISGSDLTGVTVAYATGGNGTVSDLAGNLLATNATGVVIAAWDAAPTMVSASRQSNTVLFVTLSENANDATLTQANDGGFTVFETGTPATAYAVSATAKQGSNSNIVELTVADMTASAAAGVTVTYSSTGNGIIADTTGNDMATDATGVLASAWA